MTYWDQYEGEGGGFEYVRFANIGDSVRGKIIELRDGEDFGGSPCPEIEFQTDDGGIAVWTVGQRVAQRKLLEVRPQVGWEVEVRYSGDGEGKPGKAPAKLFEIEVISNGSEPAAAAAPAAPADVAAAAPTTAADL